MPRKHPFMTMDYLALGLGVLFGDKGLACLYKALGSIPSIEKEEGGNEFFYLTIS